MPEERKGPLSELLGVLEDCAEFLAAVARAGMEEVRLEAPPELHALLLAGLFQRVGGSWVAVTVGGRRGEELGAALRAYLGEAVVDFPAWDLFPGEPISPRPDVAAQRIRALKVLKGREEVLVLVPLRALLEPLVPGAELLEPVVVEEGSHFSPEELVLRLTGLGYERVELVRGRGELARRGGIVDFFSPLDPHPVRVEFFGDEVESVREFSASTQRSLGRKGRAEAWPCRELLPGPEGSEVRRRAEEAARRFPSAWVELERLARGEVFDGMEALLPLLWPDGLAHLGSMLAGARVVLVEPEVLGARAAELRLQAEEYAAAAFGGTAPVEGSLAAPSAALPDWEEVLASFGLRPVAISSFRQEGFWFEAEGWEGMRGKPEAIAARLTELARAGWRVAVSAGGAGTLSRALELLRSSGLPEGVPQLRAVSPPAPGFLSPRLRLAHLSEEDLFGRPPAQRGKASPARQRVEPDFTPGDYVVHEAHGVARYLGTTTRELGDTVREYLVLEYAEGDRLYVPLEQISQVSKYTGGEKPRLQRLGTRDWEKTKARVKRATKDMARELLEIYAARMKARGHAFSPDTPWQRELEDAFPYQETPDQLLAVEETKRDMEEPVPMDRLICGDVAYGKTEVAVRAAFKAVMDGKQVAILVPTTLLAHQHYRTFSERYAPFPVRVALLSRILPRRQQEEVVRALAEGGVDVVIGTHRLLQPDVRFKDLGLVVIDEEHRFGVRHKEHFKRLRTEVDVLALTATPIPRTLELSLSGLRPMTVMETPPEDRYPVATYIGPYDEAKVAAAIRRELAREGQVYYVRNRVQGIERVVRRIEELVPGARVSVAHGQMLEADLEKVMLQFWEGELDVLVCTTIVESGLDVPRANTLIVERADALGLAQLHQLRGRVGRSEQRAYAYFFYPPSSPLSPEAVQRLSAISKYAELGSGFSLALKDLEIRGAGNLLGVEQHGHIAAVGFDLYVKLLSEAVEEARTGRPPAPPPQASVDLPVRAFIPSSYVASEALRMEAYRKLASATSPEEVEAVRGELRDRYGPLPREAENLVEVARLRTLLLKAGVREVRLFEGELRFEPVRLAGRVWGELLRRFPGSRRVEEPGLLFVPVPLGEEPLARALAVAELILRPAEP